MNNAFFYCTYIPSNVYTFIRLYTILIDREDLSSSQGFGSKDICIQICTSTLCASVDIIKTQKEFLTESVVCCSEKGDTIKGKLRVRLKPTMDNNAKKPFLQRIEGFVFISCLYVFFQGGYASGFIPVTLGVWEKVFRLTALETSPAVSSYTFAKLASAIPLTYFCSPGHIPKHLAWQCAICALSALITAIPWIAAQAESSTPVANLCYVGGHPDAASCDKKVDSSGLQYFVFTL